MDGRRLFFRFAYRFRFKPWDSDVPPPELVELVEGPSGLSPGQAIDLGCGEGASCRYLLDHGWDVTGVDFVPRALGVARRKAREATLIVGDVTKLAELGVDGPFDLMLDMGCFHAISYAAREAYVREAARVARQGTTLLMFAFVEKGPGSVRLGATEAEIREEFRNSFNLVDVRPGVPVQDAPGRWQKTFWYRLERKAA